MTNNSANIYESFPCQVISFSREHKTGVTATLFSSNIKPARCGQFMMLQTANTAEHFFHVNADLNDISESFTITFSTENEELKAFATAVESGATIFARGPYGQFFKKNNFVKRKIVFICEDEHLTPFRGILTAASTDSEQFPDISLIYTCENESSFYFRNALTTWRMCANIHQKLSVRTQSRAWSGTTANISEFIALAPDFLADATIYTAVHRNNLDKTILNILDLSLLPENVYVFIDNSIHCGIGKCHWCSVGKLCTCTDGIFLRLSDCMSYLDIDSLRNKT